MLQVGATLVGVVVVDRIGRRATLIETSIQVSSCLAPIMSLIWSGPALSCPALPCPALPCPALPCPALPCPALPCPALPCPALPCPALPCPALPCPALPCPALPQLALPSSAFILPCPHVGTALRCPALLCFHLVCTAHNMHVSLILPLPGCRVLHCSLGRPHHTQPWKQAKW